MMPKKQALGTMLFACSFLCAMGLQGSRSAADSTSAENRAKAIEFFEARIRPLFIERCEKCHTGGKAKGGVRLDRAEAVDDPNILVPGRPDKSPLFHAVEQSGDVKMPPNSKLTASEIMDLKVWIAQGAVWPQSTDVAGKSKPAPTHWAFRPLQRPPLPTVRDSAWPRSPIDQFIRAKLEAAELQPVGDAERRALLRRASFDLIGLPPTPAEQESFVADQSPTAFEAVIERLLASPHYGERWGRHWMDIVRYADTAGDNADYPVPESYLYRDYIIDSFNVDKPFDRFIREQIAGDLIEGPPESAKERTIATGYLALARRYATAPYEFWHLTLEDAVDTIGQSILGLTLRCARCHDHKFDPVSMRDYYALYGILDSTRFPWAGGEEFQSKSTPRMHFVPLALPTHVAAATQRNEERKRQLKAAIEQFEKTNELPKEMAALDRQIKEIDGRLTAAGKTATATAAIREERKRLDDRRKRVRKELQEKLKNERQELRLRERHGLPPELPSAYAVAEGTPRNACIQQRGNPQSPGPEVKRGDLSHLPFGKMLSIGAQESGRKQLADWLTAPENPLPARVWVNRVWQHHFGRGLVATPSNFGTRGAPPSHPELLDYLAADFVANGWSTKRLHRMILRSRVWQLASHGGADGQARDPSNALLWRAPRRRLEAEAIRDAMLSVSAKLDLARPGPHSFPPIHAWNWTQHNQFKELYPSRCRSVYLMVPRLQRHPFLALFDGPDANATTATRTESTVPLQALYLLNGAEPAEYAAAFARRLLNLKLTHATRIDHAYRLAYARPPSGIEAGRAQEFLNQFGDAVAINHSSVDADRLAWTAFCRTLLTSNEFLYVD